MTDRPKVSVVVPSYNQARFVRDTLQSVLAQRGPTFELLVMDGGSTDGTIPVLNEFAGRLHWESIPDQGVYEALNRGFSNAQGEYVGWLNSDDVYFSRDVLQRVVDEFEANPGIDVLFGDVAVISKDNRLLRLRLVPRYDRDRLERSNIIVQPAAFLRRRVVEKEKLRSLISLDYEYWIRLGRKGFSFKHVPALLAGDRQYASRLSVRRHADIVDEMGRYRREFGIPTQPPAVRARLDRLQLGVLRLLGLARVVKLIMDRKRSDHMAFPMQIDSPYRLIARQLLRSSTDVGLDT